MDTPNLAESCLSVTSLEDNDQLGLSYLLIYWRLLMHMRETHLLSGSCQYLGW